MFRCQFVSRGAQWSFRDCGSGALWKPLKSICFKSGVFLLENLDKIWAIFTKIYNNIRTKVLDLVQRQWAWPRPQRGSLLLQLKVSWVLKRNSEIHLSIVVVCGLAFKFNWSHFPNQDFLLSCPVRTLTTNFFKPCGKQHLTLNEPYLKFFKDFYIHNWLQAYFVALCCTSLLLWRKCFYPLWGTTLLWEGVGIDILNIWFF